MRLQLSSGLLAVAVALAGGAADAEPAGEATLRIYVDDDDITVISPSVHAAAEAGGVSLAADATADVVSGASIDVITSASPRPIDERRLELGVRAARPLPSVGEVAATVRGTHENDHDGIHGGVTLRRELLGHRLTAEARYLGGAEALGSATDATFRRTRTRHQAALGATLVLGPRTVLSGVVEWTRIAGYQASPYRRVAVVMPDWPTPMWLDEQVPERRHTLAAEARWRRALGDAWFASLAYGAHRDTWSMTAHTASAEVRHQPGERLLLGGAVRGYLQDGADFYRDRIEGEAPAWRTRDRTLGPMRTLFASLTADAVLVPGQPWHAVVSGGVLASWFPDFALQSERRALLVTLSLSRTAGGPE